MITAFNRKLLFRDTDAEAAAKVWSVLKQQGIPYEMKTKKGTDPMERQLKQQANMRFMSGGVPATYMDDRRTYQYLIYVRKSDYAKAKEVCDL